MEFSESLSIFSDILLKRLTNFKNSKENSKLLKNISDQQFQYLQLISRTENITVGDIAQYFQVTSPTATSLIKKLEETGFIKKNVNSNDKRSIILTLTPKGKKALDVHKAAFDNIAKDITKALQPAELKQYQNFILKLNKQLTEN